MELYLGLDWSSNECVFALVRHDGVVLEDGQVSRQQSRVDELADRLKERFGGQLEAIIESGSPGWVELLLGSGLGVRVVDAKQASAFAGSLGSSGAKDDKRDAANLAKMGFSPAHRPPLVTPDDPSLVRADELTRELEATNKDLRRCCQQIRQRLKNVFPELASLLQPTELFREWVCRLIEVAPTRYHLNELTWAEFEGLMAGSRIGAGKKRTVYDCLRAATAAKVVPEEVHLARGRELVRRVQRLRLLHLGRVAIEKELDNLADTIPVPATLKKTRSIGTRLALALALEAFPHGAPENRDEAAIRMGAAPVFRGSGKHKNGRRKGQTVMRTAASRRAKAATFLLGRAAMRHLEWGRAMFIDGRKRGHSPARMYRAIARSLLRILTAVLRTGIPYNEDHYIARLKLKGVGWAAELETSVSAEEAISPHPKRSAKAD